MHIMTLSAITCNAGMQLLHTAGIVQRVRNLAAPFIPCPALASFRASLRPAHEVRGAEVRPWFLLIQKQLERSGSFFSDSRMTFLAVLRMQSLGIIQGRKLKHRLGGPKLSLWCLTLRYKIALLLRKKIALHPQTLRDETHVGMTCTSALSLISLAFHCNPLLRKDNSIGRRWGKIPQLEKVDSPHLFQEG